ncbi:MAG: hemerythrin [Nitrospirales bacterium]|nr:MAG: hemerythrin [Nitrospirales bacterium]
MTIYQALKNDHQEAKKLFADLEQTKGKNGNAREKLFTELKAALEAHSEAEEEVFYSPLKKNEETKEKIQHANKEHDKVAKTLTELEDMDKDNEQWLKKVTQLQEDVQHHIKEEEEEIFQKARGIFSEQQAEDMAQEFEQAKNQKAMKT